MDLSTSGITINDVALRTQFGQKRMLSRPSTNCPNSYNYAEKQKKRNNGAAQPQKFKGIHDIVEQDSNQSNSLKKMKRQEIDLEADKKSDESTDDEVSSTILMSEPDRNIDVEYSSPTNIPQNQKLIEKQTVEHKLIKTGLHLSRDVSAIGELEEKDTSNLLPVSEQGNITDIKYRLRFKIYLF